MATKTTTTTANTKPAATKPAPVQAQALPAPTPTAKPVLLAKGATVAPGTLCSLQGVQCHAPANFAGYKLARGLNPNWLNSHNGLVLQPCAAATGGLTAWGWGSSQAAGPQASAYTKGTITVALPAAAHAALQAAAAKVPALAPLAAITVVHNG